MCVYAVLCCLQFPGLLSRLFRIVVMKANVLNFNRAKHCIVMVAISHYSYIVHMVCDVTANVREYDKKRWFSTNWNAFVYEFCYFIIFQHVFKGLSFSFPCCFFSSFHSDEDKTCHYISLNEKQNWLKFRPNKRAV